VVVSLILLGAWSRSGLMAIAIIGTLASFTWAIVVA
jgi:hypothetical protein